MRLLKVANAMPSKEVGGPAVVTCAVGVVLKFTHPVLGACPVSFQGHGFQRGRGPHTIPPTPGSVASTPHKTHGQNGTIGHLVARLLSWRCSPYKLFVQVEGLTAIAVTGASNDDWTSEKRKVGGSTPPLTTNTL
jgi:hypothetical protein